MGLLIDTGVFIDWEKSGGSIRFSNWNRLGNPYVSVITESELWVGVYRANSDRRRETRSRFVSTILAHVVVLPIDSKIAQIHASIVAQLSQSGRTIGAHDAWIAATALRHNYDLLTTNASEFERVPGLRVHDFLATEQSEGHSDPG